MTKRVGPGRSRGPVDRSSVEHAVKTVSNSASDASQSPPVDNASAMAAAIVR